MRLTEQFRNRLQKLAGLKSKQPKLDPKPLNKPKPISPPPPPLPQPADCASIDTFFDGCPEGSQCAGFNSKEEFCNRCSSNYEFTQQWAEQNNLPNCDCCYDLCDNGTVEQEVEMFACVNCQVQSIGMMSTCDLQWLPGLTWCQGTDPILDPGCGVWRDTDYQEPEASGCPDPSNGLGSAVSAFGNGNIWLNSNYLGTSDGYGCG